MAVLWNHVTTRGHIILLYYLKSVLLVSFGEVYFKERWEKSIIASCKNLAKKEKRTQARLLQEPSLYVMVLCLTVCYFVG